MKVEIFIVTYAKDLPYLTYCLRSIKKFATGFSGVTLLVPEREAQIFSQFDGVTIKTYQVHADPRFHHIGHQGEKCRADFWCPEADFIFHMDSDCIFSKPAAPEDYFTQGKPQLLIDDYSRVGGAAHWKGPTEGILRMPVRFETMRRHPAIHYRDLYRDAREHVETAHGMGFMDFVFTRKPDYPWGISEFNLLGAYVLARNKWKPEYAVVNLEFDPVPESSKNLIQFWSHSAPEKPQDMPCGGCSTPLEKFNELGL